MLCICDIAAEDTHKRAAIRSICVACDEGGGYLPRGVSSLLSKIKSLNYAQIINH